MSTFININSTLAMNNRKITIKLQITISYMIPILSSKCDENKWSAYVCKSDLT